MRAENALGIPKRQLDRARRPGRHTDDGDRVEDPQLIEQGGVRIRLRARGRIVGDRRTEIAESRGCDDIVAGAEQLVAQHEALIVAAAGAVDDQHGRARPLATALDQSAVRRHELAPGFDLRHDCGDVAAIDAVKRGGGHGGSESGSDSKQSSAAHRCLLVLRLDS